MDHPGYGAEVDMFSCGAIIFALLGGYLPWPTKDEEKLKANLRTKVVAFDDPSWEEVSAEAMELLVGLLDKNPIRRVKADKALRATWFQLDSGDLGRNTLYRCHANFTTSLDHCQSLAAPCTSQFGTHVHESIEQKDVERDAEPQIKVLDAPKTELHAWDVRAEHGYTNFGDLDLGTALGEGAFAIVRVGVNRVTKAKFAVKEAPHKIGHDPTRTIAKAPSPRAVPRSRSPKFV